MPPRDAALRQLDDRLRGQAETPSARQDFGRGFEGLLADVDLQDTSGKSADWKRRASKARQDQAIQQRMAAIHAAQQEQSAQEAARDDRIRQALSFHTGGVGVKVGDDTGVVPYGDFSEDFRKNNPVPPGAQPLGLDINKLSPEDRRWLMKSALKSQGMTEGVTPEGNKSYRMPAETVDVYTGK